MLIGIDASRATSAAPTGTETYSRELIRALIAMDRKNQYRLISARQSTTELFFAKFQNHTNYHLRSYSIPPPLDTSPPFV